MGTGAAGALTPRQPGRQHVPGRQQLAPRRVVATTVLTLLQTMAALAVAGASIGWRLQPVDWAAGPSLAPHAGFANRTMDWLVWPADNRTWVFMDDVDYTDPSCPGSFMKQRLKTTDDAGNTRTVRLWAGSRFPVATRSKDPFRVNLARYLNATARLRDVVDIVSPSCFDIAGLHDTSSPGLHGLQMQPGCVERVRGLHAQGFRVEPLIGAGKNCTIDCIRLRLRDKAWISACADAMSVLNASGLVFDIELETSTEADGLSFANLLTAVREVLRSRVPDAAVSVATGKKPRPFAPFYTKNDPVTKTLRDTHRENSKQTRFSQAPVGWARRTCWPTQPRIG